jgi:hypothetical protein
MIHIMYICIHYCIKINLCQAHHEIVENIIRVFVNYEGNENVSAECNGDIRG